MRNQTVALLESLGVTCAGDTLLDFALSAAIQRILSLTNLTGIPAGLAAVTAEMAAGEYLYCKKNAGQLEGFDLEAAVKQIKEGDTATTFALGEGSATPEQRLDSLIDFLRGGHMAEIYRFRRLIW